ncbi:MAG: lamin tail domain-containing protein [Clostridia bacterium]|nr:lamin tail domain-containing protein [Clostridia bacterium]
MKKSLFVLLLSVCLLLLCVSAYAADGLMIRSVYGGGIAADNACASTHSYVELYNDSDSSVSLSGYSLQYKSADSDNWVMLRLSGTVPAKHSFLVRGSAHISNRLYITGDVGRVNLYDGDYDMSWSQLLNNKECKVVLMQSTALLTVSNPFDIDGAGTKASGYVDMVSATTTASTIAETAPVFDISKQNTIVRANLVDTDNNSVDFIAADLRFIDLEMYGPRSLASGAYTPETYTQAPTSIPPIVINQAYGGGDSGDNGTAVTHGFIELYNPTDSAVSLNGWSLQYAPEGAAYARLKLSGTLAAHTSYLVRCGEHINDTSYISGNVGRLNLFNASYDKTWDIYINNKGAKIVLLATTQPLTSINPFDTDGQGTKAYGYVDMIGMGNLDGDTDGGEKDPVLGQSKQKALRRVFFTDTDNNDKDFLVVDYRTAELSFVRPRSTKDGAWQCTDSSLPSVPEHLSSLMINQVYGGGWALDCPFSHTFVEFFNAGEETISLDGCSLQYGEVGGFTEYASLDGYAIPPKHSFLIRCLDNPEALVGVHFIRYDMTDPSTYDVSFPEFVISNNSFSVGICYGVTKALGDQIDPAAAACVVDYVRTNDTSKQKTLRATNFEKGNMESLRFELVSDRFVADYRPRSLKDGAQETRNDLRYYASTIYNTDPLVDDYVSTLPASGEIEIGTVFNNLTGIKDTEPDYLYAVQYGESDEILAVSVDRIKPDNLGMKKKEHRIIILENTKTLKIFLWDGLTLRPYIDDYFVYTK